MTTLSNILSLKTYFNAEIILILGTVSLILLSLCKNADSTAGRKAFYATLVFLGLALAAVLCLPAQKSVGLFEGMMAYDAFGRFFRIFILLTAMVATLLADKSYDLRATPKVEFYGFLLALTLGLNIMCTATNLLTVYLAIEMASIMSYVMTGYLSFGQLFSARSEEAGLKYVFYGGMASGVMIFGISAGCAASAAESVLPLLTASIDSSMTAW